MKWTRDLRKAAPAMVATCLLVTRRAFAHGGGDIAGFHLTPIRGRLIWGALATACVIVGLKILSRRALRRAQAEVDRRLK